MFMVGARGAWMMGVRPPGGAGMLKRGLRAALVLFVISGLSFAEEKTAATIEPTATTTSAPAATAAPPRPREILTRAKAALAAAGTIKANIILNVHYPHRYTSSIVIYASATGEERAEMTTVQDGKTHRSLEILTKGVLWTRQETPQGKLATKIDINRVKRALREADETFTITPIIGANALFDLSRLAEIIDFNRVKPATHNEKPTWIISGEMAERFAGKSSLPVGAARYYSTASVHIDSKSFLPVRIELGSHQGKPVMSLEFKSIETKVEAPPGTFDYTPGEDVEVVDRTDWAIAQLRGT